MEEKISLAFFEQSYKRISILMMTILIVIGPFISSFGNVHAATNISAELQPGKMYDTGGHQYNSADFGLISNWTIKSTTNATGSYWQGKWLNMDTNGQSRGVWAIYNYALDFSQPFSVSFQEKANGGSFFGGWRDLGDSLGMIFTSQPVDSLNTGKTGPGLGVDGLKNSVYAGRDFYYNDTVGDNSLGTIWPGKTSTQMRIATTDSKGTLNSSGSSSNGINPVADAGTMPKDGEQVRISWTNGQNLGNGTAKGDMTLTIGSKSITYPNLTVPMSMSVGLLGATGGSYSAMSFVPGTDLVGYKATKNITVNYLDKDTGQPMQGMAASSIKANIGDKIGLTTSSSSPENINYAYKVPGAPTGYQFDSLSKTSLTVSNFEDGQNDPNVINVYYQKNTIKAVFDFKGNDQVINLPQDIVETGHAGDNIPAPSINLPSGVTVSSVKGPDGKTYPTMDEAIKNNAKYPNTGEADFFVNLDAFSIDHVPNIGFGEQKWKSGLALFNTTSDYQDNLQVSNTFSQGWKLQGKISKVFTADDGTKQNKLNDAILTFNTTNNNLFGANLANESSFSINDKAASIVASADSGRGIGKNIININSVQLSTNQSTIVLHKQYNAEITWTLGNTPGQVTR